MRYCHPSDLFAEKLGSDRALKNILVSTTVVVGERWKKLFRVETLLDKLIVRMLNKIIRVITSFISWSWDEMLTWKRLHTFLS